EAQRLGHVRIGFRARERGSHLDRDLLIADRRLERGVVRAEEPVDHRLLVLLDASYGSEGLAQLRGHPRRIVAEAQRFGLYPVHENDADAREGVIVELADRFADQLAPREPLPLERRSLSIEEAERHRRSPWQSGPDAVDATAKQESC